jgi:hypothetical protein
MKQKDLLKMQSNCTPQESLILSIISKRKLTPFEVLEKYEKHNPRVPITSIRRAITNLTDRGLLEKTPNFKVERYGKTNHLWKLQNWVK